MLKSAIITATAMLFAGSIMAQKKQDEEAIKKLCGCFAVTFNYAETFTHDTVHKKYAHPMDNFAVTEYAYPIATSKNKYVIQHLLVIPDDKGTVIKHWREDWEYEQTERWQYTNAKEWRKVRVPLADVKGEWTQSVWEVSDAPRYVGSSAWVQANKQTFWLNTTDAPLPRREYTTRKDYNILNRTNRITVAADGYLHEQDNKKIIRKSGTADSLLAEEKGYNKYVRLPDSDCAKARAFWTNAIAEYWQEVRQVWSDKMKVTDKVTLQNRIDGKYLFEKLDELQDKPFTGTERKAAITKVITQYLQEKPEEPEDSHKQGSH
ncbi:DUF6607 family protein [Chitinophaga nivalis]|uniref:Uncharacterized protein n=1 Tax=Chitinophaga nivalis TaxID=2991709 RepID=A0ABT3IH49_9BACT|nr:DUF6607 family protein [Chitinophaga nivalis]MCW3467016.1 hypothetical protein [Chitinophaga nivalis]MCW3483293.1 hypothetical protein [Chitinophaga nivalis]